VVDGPVAADAQLRHEPDARRRELADKLRRQSGRPRVARVTQHRLQL